MAIKKQELEGKVFFENKDIDELNIHLPFFNSKETKLIMNDIENETNEYAPYVLSKSTENLFIGVVFSLLSIALVVLFFIFFTTVFNFNFGLFFLYIISFILLLATGIVLSSEFICKSFQMKRKIEPITTERDIKVISENLTSEKSRKYLRQFSVKRKYHIFAVINHNYYNKFIELEKEFSEILEK